jgi:signal peptidase I
MITEKINQIDKCRRVLRLTIKKHWFDMIASGEKRQEYRVPSNWILSRLIGKQYDAVEFSNGYGKHVPKSLVKYLGWHRNQGDANPKWGAIPGQRYIIIRLGNVISLHNVLAHPRGQEEPEKQTECFPASDAAPC